MPPRPSHYSGDVHWINHSVHSGPSSEKTIKNWHYAVILTGNLYLSKPSCPLVSYVPMTSFKPEKHWDAVNDRLKYPQDVLIKMAQYTELTYDTIIDCGQVFTCDYECFNEFKFRLKPQDLIAVRKRLAVTLGYQ